MLVFLLCINDILKRDRRAKYSHLKVLLNILNGRLFPIALYYVKLHNETCGGLYCWILSSMSGRGAKLGGFMFAMVQT